MVMYVPFVAMCLNFDVFVPRIIPILLTWTILLLLPYVLLKKRFLYTIAASILFLDGFINRIFDGFFVCKHAKCFAGQGWFRHCRRRVQ